MTSKMVLFIFLRALFFSVTALPSAGYCTFVEEGQGSQHYSYPIVGFSEYRIFKKTALKEMLVLDCSILCIKHHNIVVFDFSRLNTKCVTLVRLIQHLKGLQIFATHSKGE